MTERVCKPYDNPRWYLALCAWALVLSTRALADAALRLYLVVWPGTGVYCPGCGRQHGHARKCDYVRLWRLEAAERAAAAEVGATPKGENRCV